MNQRLSTSFFCLFFLLCSLWSGAVPAAAGTQAQSTYDSTFSEGLGCLSNSDISCARIALLKIPAQQLLAKILDGAIAIAEGNDDRAFRLLLPIQVSDASANADLPPAAAASLHASLASAYEHQGNVLRSLEQRMALESVWQTDSEQGDAHIHQNQQAIWKMLSALDHAQLVEIRGESADSTIQGWIDLALGVRSGPDADTAIEDWRGAYPDHPAQTELIRPLITATAPAPAQSSSASGSRIALLLPFGNSAYYPAADAIERGFMAAKNRAGDQSEVIIYPTSGDKNQISAAYRQAINEGARFVVGPLTRSEVTALATGKLDVPTLTLNQAETNFTLHNLYSLGLSLDNEARQITKTARDAGMQSAVIIAADNAPAIHMAKTFTDAWVNEGGQLLLQANIHQNTNLDELQAELASTPSDMILLATGPELARLVRAHLDITTPTYGFSHIYNGINYEPEDRALLAVHFMDLPWVLAADQAAFDPYKSAAADLPQGMMQRWFALGVDAYQVLTAIAANPHHRISLQGLTGKLEIDSDGNIKRTLAVGRFTHDGVVLERAP